MPREGKNVLFAGHSGHCAVEGQEFFNPLSSSSGLKCGLKNSFYDPEKIHLFVMPPVFRESPTPRGSRRNSCPVLHPHRSDPTHFRENVENPRHLSFNRGRFYCVCSNRIMPVFDSTVDLISVLFSL